MRVKQNAVVGPDLNPEHFMDQFSLAELTSATVQILIRMGRHLPGQRDKKQQRDEEL